MVALSSILQALTPAAGAGIGFALGGPAGAIIGGAGGQAVASGIGLFQEPSTEAFQPTASQRLALDRSEYITSQLMSGQGLSDTFYSRALSGAADRATSVLSTAISLAREAPQVSSLTLGRLAKESLRQASGILEGKQQELEALDVQQVMNNLKLAITSNRESSLMAEQIRQAQMQAQVKYEQQRQAQLQQFSNTMQQLASAIFVASQLPQKEQPVVQTTEQPVMQDLQTPTTQQTPIPTPTTPTPRMSQQPITGQTGFSESQFLQNEFGAF